MLQTTTDTVHGQPLRVARLGQGPPLLLLHGYPDNLQIWCELAPRLAERCTATAFDWPGMGCSASWPGATTPAGMAGRLLALLDAWGIERADFAAMDVGGQPALAFAALHPERIRRLVIMNCLAYGDENTSWEIGLLRKMGWNRLLLRRLPWLVFRRAVGTSLPWTQPLPADLRADFWDGFRQAEVRRFIARLCAGYQATLPQLPELYGRIACPTLVLWGGRDKHFPPVHGQRLHAAVAGSRLHVVADGEHWMVWHRADKVAEQVRAFLEEAG